MALRLVSISWAPGLNELKKTKSRTQKTQYVLAITTVVSIMNHSLASV